MNILPSAIPTVGCNFVRPLTWNYFTNLKNIFIFLAFITQGCKNIDPIQSKPFPIKNNPTHNFKLSIDKLKDTITSMFSIENQIDNKILNNIFYYYSKGDSETNANRHLITFETESSQDTLFSKDYFSKASTSNDIYLHDFNFSWLSKLYFSNGKPLEYRTPFIIKLLKINNDSTTISVIAEDPKVLNGISGYGPHGPIARETVVEPTSIEEYSILLFIADKLGDKTLVPLKLPNDQ